jgi:hypothetical protein
VNKKGFVNIILVIIIIILVGLVGYFAFVRKPEVPLTTQTPLVNETAVKEAVIGFLKAKQSRNFENAKPFLSSEFVKTIDPVGFAGTSNPHTGRFEIQDVQLLPDGETYRINTRVYQEYTGEGDIGYNDNSYYVKLFGDSYLIDNIEYGEYVELLKTETPKPVDWENLVPIIQTVIGPTFLGVRVGERPMSIWQTSDITGDGVPEALVYLGQGGAYTSYLTLMRIENDKPVVAQFKQKDGEISPLMFLDGASVMNGESVVMLPEKNVIYAGHWSRTVSGEPYGGLSNCKVEAYQWNLQTKIFNFSQIFSNEIRPGYCQKADI